MDNLIASLSQIMARSVGGGGAISNITRLSGGANMESSSFDWAGAGYVLRRAPSPELMEGRAFDHDVEATIVRKAREQGVLAPLIVGELSAEDGIGTGYIMARVEGEVRPDRILANPPLGLITDIARELACIHAIPPPEALPIAIAADMVAGLKERFVGYGGNRPVMALSLAWLEANIPPPAPRVFLHGDFRMGNLMFDTKGLAAVLDWELAHIGDAHEDLVWGCVNSWRFGHSDKPAFGLSDLATYWAAYEAQSGTRVDPERFHFWLVFRTLWWGLCCLQMADIWRSGTDRSLERAVIGRRASETEVDLLLLLEHRAPEAERYPIARPIATVTKTTGEPSVAELLEALTTWVSTDIRPAAQGRDRFMASVALNALGILKRESEAEENRSNQSFCDDLLSSRLTLDSPGVLVRLRLGALAKLAIDQPNYSAFGAAIALWEAPLSWQQPQPRAAMPAQYHQ